MKADKLSLWLGIIVTVLVAGLLIVYFRSVNKPTGVITDNASTTEYKEVEVLSAQTANDLPVQYTIQQGDSLWKIAQTVYGNGFEWTKIYENNKTQIQNADILEIGTKITVPKLENQDELKTYTVKKGDSLWKIASKTCGTGYAWSGIAAQNNLANPSIIHPGNTLNFYCKAQG